MRKGYLDIFRNSGKEKSVEPFYFAVMHEIPRPRLSFCCLWPPGKSERVMFLCPMRATIDYISDT